MKLLQRFLGKEQRSATPDLCSPSYAGLRTIMGYTNPEQASRHVVIHRCVQLISESLSLVPCRLYRVAANDGRTPASDQPLYSVLQDQFNPNLNAFEGREWLIASVLITGNGYAKKEYNNAGQVTALYPMSPGSVGVDRLTNGRLRYNWSRPDGRSEVLLQEEMLHIRYRTKDGFIGISPIQHAMPHMGLALTQLDQATAQTEKAFQAPGALVTSQLLTPDQRQSILEKFRERFIGALKAGEPMVLDGGFKWEGFSIPNKDAEFIDSRKLSNLDLCRIYGVPPSAVGITDNATYSNIGEESRALVARCIAPMAARVEQAMNASLLTPEARKTLFIEHDLAGLLRGDLGARYTAYKTGREAGFLSVNEIRKFENMPQIAGGDEYLSPLNMTPAGTRQEAAANG